MSSIHRFVGDSSNMSWEGVSATTYESEELKGVFKHLLVGPQDQAPNFEMRYFRFNPSSHSDLVRHDKDYAFFVLHGNAKMQVNDDFFELHPFDVAYVSMGELLQFTTLGEEPFGVICVTVAAEK